MFKKIYLLLFPFTIFSAMNPSLANSNEDNWFNYGFNGGLFSQTCLLAVDKIISTEEAKNEMEFVFENAKNTLNSDFYEYFREFAYEEKDCKQFLP